MKRNTPHPNDIIVRMLLESSDKLAIKRKKYSNFTFDYKNKKTLTFFMEKKYYENFVYGYFYYELSYNGAILDVNKKLKKDLYHLLEFLHKEQKRKKNLQIISGLYKNMKII